MEEARLPAHVEVSALIRRIESEGGFATVIRKGQRESGTLLVVLCENGENMRVYERMPQLDGRRIWHCSKRQSTENTKEIDEYLDRRVSQDSDLWILELDVANGERFIGLA